MATAVPNISNVSEIDETVLFYSLLLLLFVCHLCQDNIGNEVEVAGRNENVDLGPYLTIEHLRSLEQKLMQVTKVILAILT